MYCFALLKCSVNGNGTAAKAICHACDVKMANVFPKGYDKSTRAQTV